MNLRSPEHRLRAGAGRPLTGRAVLAMLLGFFGLVIAVNLVMVRAAISTFGGVDTPSSYQAGLAFKAEEAAVAAQDARAGRSTRGSRRRGRRDGDRDRGRRGRAGR